MHRTATIQDFADHYDDMQSDGPRPSQRSLYRKLRELQRQHATARGKREAEIMRDMLRVSKEIDAA
jgi:hypothetical protein